ncbi:hypothetical protein C3B79_0931 [Aeromonas hydrophila]|nr:hypothetical protein C3B79_0931 [Aeromonas hydrophila]
MASPFPLGDHVDRRRACFFYDPVDMPLHITSLITRANKIKDDRLIRCISQ